MRSFTVIIMILIFLGVMLFDSSCSQNTKEIPLISNSNNKATFKSKIVVISDSAFGYEILQNNSVYIRQLNVPAVPGHYYFKDKNQAQKVAELVIIKLNKGIFPPTISLTELDSLKIERPQLSE